MPNNKLYDKGKVIAGLVVFGILLAFPFLYNLGKAAPAPEPKLLGKAAEPGAECIRPKADMKAEHMKILNVWRDRVVRSAERIYVTGEGKKYEMSLSNTCLDCHAGKAEFCDACHNYAAVTPYCWDCHFDPKEMK